MNVIKVINLLITICLTGGFLVSLWLGYSVTPTDMITLAVLSTLNVVILGMKSNKNQQS
jgi:hypothetical protein